MTLVNETLYAKYIMERESARILENESGFLTYKVLGDEAFICEMFIEKEKRSTGLFKTMIENLSSLMIFEGCRIIGATIYLADKHATSTLQSALRVGFKVAKAEHGVIVIYLDLKGAK